jgi:hypothetical protein
MDMLFPGRKPPHQFLKEFYAQNGIHGEGNEGVYSKHHLLKRRVIIPNYPSGKEPSLSELERQLLKENGYCI